MVVGVTMTVENAPSPNDHWYETIVAPPAAVDALASNRIVCVTGSISAGENTAVGAPLLTVTDFETTPVRPALSVTTRFTANVPLAVKTCVVIPSAVQAASPGQCTIGVESPKFQSSATMRCPCGTVDVRQSKTTVSPMAGVDGENVKFALGPGVPWPPTVTVVPADVDDCPASSVIVTWTM